VAATYHGFVDRFPEFNEYELPPESIELEIAAASRRLNSSAWGEQWDDGVLLLAAHNVVRKHRVKCCKLISADDETTYLAEYMLMREAIISGDRVF
jgi:hypothetical protein